MLAEQFAARRFCADAMAHFIRNTPAPFANDGGLAAAYRKDGDKKDTHVMVNSLEVRLPAAAERT
jgi:hypothetical protein